MRKLLVVLLLLFSASAYATDYYVRTDGNNVRCDGTEDIADTGQGSAGSPDHCAWATPSKCATTLTAGNRCIVRAGTYHENAKFTQANAGTVSWNVKAACTCTKGSSTVTCSSTIAGIVAGDRVRCGAREERGVGTGIYRFPDDPYFAWQRVASVNNATITLEAPYEGKTLTDVALHAAKFIEFIGNGRVEVTSTINTDQPTWIQDGTYSNVWYYNKSTHGGPWLNPYGFRQESNTWDRWYRMRNGKDSYIKAAPTGCPCGVASCKQAVSKIAGSWCIDGDIVYLQTMNGGDPNSVTLDVQGIVGQDYALWVSNKAFTRIDNFVVYSPAGSATGINDGAMFHAIDVGADHTQFDNITVENGTFRLNLAGGRTEMDVRHFHAYDKTVAAEAATNANSGLRFYQGEWRGGFSNGVNFGETGFMGYSETDRILVQRVFLHRMFSQYRSAVTGCDANYVDCSVAPATWRGNEEWHAVHGNETGTTTAANPSGSHVLYENNIIEITADGLNQQFGGNADKSVQMHDVIFRNNTIGWRGNYTNIRGQTIWVGNNYASTGFSVKLRNNIYTISAEAQGTGADHDPIFWDGGFVYNGDAGAAAGIDTDYNIWMAMGASTYVDEDPTTTVKLFHNYAGGGPSYTADTIRAAGKELHSQLVCYSGCNTTPNFPVYNDGANVRNAFVQYVPTDGDPQTDYTPTATFRGLNAGDNTECPTEDYYGNPRNDGSCDIGAVEQQPTAGVPLPDPTIPSKVLHPSLHTGGFDYGDIAADKLAWIATHHDIVIGPSNGCGTGDCPPTHLDKITAEDYDTLKTNNADVKIYSYVPYNSVLPWEMTWMTEWCAANPTECGTTDTEDLWCHYRVDTPGIDTNGDGTINDDINGDGTIDAQPQAVRDSTNQHKYKGWGCSGGETCTATSRANSRVHALWSNGIYTNVCPSSAPFRAAYNAMLIAVSNLGGGRLLDGVFLDTYNGTVQDNWPNFTGDRSGYGVNSRLLELTMEAYTANGGATPTPSWAYNWMKDQIIAHYKAMRLDVEAAESKPFVVTGNGAEIAYFFSNYNELFSDQFNSTDYRDWTIEYLTKPSTSETFLGGTSTSKATYWRNIYDAMVNNDVLWFANENTSYLSPPESVAQWYIAHCYILNHPNFICSYHVGSAGSYDPRTSPETLFWHPNMGYDMGSPKVHTGIDAWGSTDTNRFYVFQSGNITDCDLDQDGTVNSDPAPRGPDWGDPTSYRVYARDYDNGMVLSFIPDRGSADGGASWTRVGLCAQTINLGGFYKQLQPDNSLGSPISSISLGASQGAILIYASPPPTTTKAHFKGVKIKGAKIK